MIDVPGLRDSDGNVGGCTDGPTFVGFRSVPLRAERGAGVFLMFGVDVLVGGGRVGYLRAVLVAAEVALFAALDGDEPISIDLSSDVVEVRRVVTYTWEKKKPSMMLRLSRFMVLEPCAQG